MTVTWRGDNYGNDHGCENFFIIKAFNQNNQQIFTEWKRWKPDNIETTTNTFNFPNSQQIVKIEVQEKAICILEFWLEV